MTYDEAVVRYVWSRWHWDSAIRMAAWITDVDWSTARSESFHEEGFDYSEYTSEPGTSGIEVSVLSMSDGRRTLRLDTRDEPFGHLVFTITTIANIPEDKISQWEDEQMDAVRKRVEESARSVSEMMQEQRHYGMPQTPRRRRLG